MERSQREPEGTPPVLGPDGILASDRANADVDLATLWSHMLTARVADELFAQMQLPRFASARGEEAILAALASRVGSDDWVYPGIRDRALPLLRGVGFEQMVAQLRGAPDSETRGRLANTGTTSHLAAVACPTQGLGMHLPLATGHARALRLSQSNGVVVSLCGEGLTAHGRFHEALTLSVATQLPILFIVKRPMWTQQPPLEAGSFGQGALERARACGLWGHKVMGADVLGVIEGLDQTLARVRQRKGPCLLEVAYSPLQEDTHPDHDPLHRLRSYLERQGLLTPQRVDQQRQALVDQFHAALAAHADRISS